MSSADYEQRGKKIKAAHEHRRYLERCRQEELREKREAMAIARARAEMESATFGVRCSISVSADLRQMENWPAANVLAFMRGVGQVISAQSAVVHSPLPAPSRADD